MITVGLTGGIASGKSTAVKVFLSHGIPAIDADALARQVVAPGTEGLADIIHAFGHEYLQQDGTLDRVKLGSLVFSDKDEMRVLNSIMGPLIDKEADSQIEDLHKLGYSIVIFDGALIVESGHAEKYRPLICVHCRKVEQIERLMKRNNLTEHQAMIRINAQLPVAKKIEMADYVINTDGTIEQSVEQTEIIIEKLNALL